MKTDDSGNLVIASTAGDVLLHKPVAYQEHDGSRQPVDAKFVLEANNQVHFELGNYDRNRELVIDPSLAMHTQRILAVRQPTTALESPLTAAAMLMSLEKHSP